MPSATDEPRESLRFAESVSPDSTVQQTYKVPRDATIESVDVRIYRGAELALQVRPFLKTGVSGARREHDLVLFQGKEFIDGDGDHWTFSVSESVTQNDIIGVEVENKSSTYSYDYAVDVELDAAGGTSRFGGVVERVRGWL